MLKVKRLTIEASPKSAGYCIFGSRVGTAGVDDDVDVVVDVEADAVELEFELLLAIEEAMIPVF